ncbi:MULTISPECIES: hypothetical protein [Chryseobacterium]|uniref:Uncharacterized protein n=1 Tax=Chryseobacterium rhizosphaerae TaxID=395937 RepID=A0AAE3YCC8_9FLAO|nr:MULTISPECIES: hypothetical protein [Chryseobacterium]MBL3548169.1 hypothetical protein [Chryseobacterium sp. KMC2]MDR6527543.1 hypothetical protein [Chryseobacterium rhizosphaerae]MDR6548793.1 hypothetical protein [Chryseobacterium rhizosphaerae]REC76655.1 hypothetical protein DRF57_07500 [Chryseobacterium rhizosphaerae]GEN66862.1 hypothetical protein CRH01_14300 [Chryseobacterium rhizosphaerae]
MDTTLNIYFDKNGINYLTHTNQLVGIIRSYPGTADLKYICLAFEPFINNNPCTFSDSWQALASRIQPQNMEVYKGSVSTDAEYGNRYSVSNIGFYGTPGNCPSEVLGIDNTSTSILYPAISQKINGTFGVCNADSASVNTIIYFDYSDELWLFTASGISSNMAISSSLLVPSGMQARNVTINKYLTIDFQDDTDVYFDSATNVFKMGKLPQKK